jgi:hypothetical protein
MGNLGNLGNLGTLGTSLYLSIETVVLGGLGYRLTANSVQKFAKKYLKLGGDVTFQAASFSQLIVVDRCQRQKRDPD